MVHPMALCLQAFAGQEAAEFCCQNFIKVLSGSTAGWKNTGYNVQKGAQWRRLSLASTEGVKLGGTSSQLEPGSSSAECV